MSKAIRRTAVIGAGVMGSGSAAHFANAGLEVLLLDIVPPNLSDAEKKDKKARNRFAAGGLEKALKSRPAAFFHKSNARLVSVGNTEDDLEKLKDYDLVIEAVIERSTSSRRSSRSSKVCRRTPTRGVEHLGASHPRHDGRAHRDVQKNFLVMHFFTPVR